VVNSKTVKFNGIHLYWRLHRTEGVIEICKEPVYYK